ncbi:MAG TPA: antibiotic biosynthesis monooxygenase [Desulfuromonadaceae bacterium]|jgi:quinol monooxygenase YgiN
MIDTAIKMKVPLEKRKEVLQTVKVILVPIRRERGCISCDCYADVEDENTLYFKEEWKSWQDLESHLKSQRFAVLIGAMSLLAVEPDIVFSIKIPTAGIEAINAAKNALLKI